MLTVIRPREDPDEVIGESRAERMDSVLAAALRDRPSRIVEKVRDIQPGSLKNAHILFAVCLTSAGVNIELYRLLEYLRANPDCLEGSVGGIIVDGGGEIYTKNLARRTVFSANLAGCAFPGKPLVEATGSLGNFHVLSKILGIEPMEVYRRQVRDLCKKVERFDYRGWGGGLSSPAPHSGAAPDSSGLGDPSEVPEAPDRPGPWVTPDHDQPNILAVHASIRRTSNTLLLWDMIRETLDGHSKIKEVSLRSGEMPDCRGCPYEACLHFGEKGGCFYGGIMVEEVYPAIRVADEVVMICPNYNDALSANLTAFVNRLTAVFRVHDFSNKSIYALIVSGYSGGDLIAEQVIGAMCFNKAFILPPRFALLETANDPRSILQVPDIRKTCARFGEGMLRK